MALYLGSVSVIPNDTASDTVIGQGPCGERDGRQKKNKKDEAVLLRGQNNNGKKPSRTVASYLQPRSDHTAGRADLVRTTGEGSSNAVPNSVLSSVRLETYRYTYSSLYLPIA